MSWGLSILGPRGEVREQKEPCRFEKIQVAKEILSKRQNDRILELGGERVEEEISHRGECRLCVHFSPP